MTELAQLYDDQSKATAQKSKKAVEKKQVDEKGSKEMRDASMQGLVPREELSDITMLEGSSKREKKAQR